MSKNRIFSLLFVLFCISLNPAITIAANEKTIYEYDLVPYIHIGSEINLNSNKIDHDIVIIGTDIIIDSEVNGNIFVIGDNIEFNSKINGSVYGFASTNVLVKSLITGSVGFISPKLELLGSADIQNDVYGLFNEVKHQGRIGGDLNISPESGSNALVMGKILGRLFYTDNRPEITERGYVESGIFNIPNVIQNYRNRQADKLLYNIYHACSLLLVFLVIKRYFHHQLKSVTNKLSISPREFLTKGLLVLIFTPLIIFLSFMSFIGIPLGLILIFSFLLILYISPIFGALVISSRVFKSNPLSLIHFTFSILIFDLILITPYIGWVFSIFSVILTLGIFYNARITAYPDRKVAGS